MNPAWSVILLTTLIGLGQGLLLAMFGVEVASRLALTGAPAAVFYLAGSALSVLCLGGGLLASFFHLGRIVVSALKAGTTTRTRGSTGMGESYD